MRDLKLIALMTSLSGSGIVEVSAVQDRSAKIILVDLLVLVLVSLVLLSILISLIIS